MQSAAIMAANATPVVLAADGVTSPATPNEGEATVMFTLTPTGAELSLAVVPNARGLVSWRHRVSPHPGPLNSWNDPISDWVLAEPILLDPHTWVADFEIVFADGVTALQSLYFTVA